MRIRIRLTASSRQAVAARLHSAYQTGHCGWSSVSTPSSPSWRANL